MTLTARLTHALRQATIVGLLAGLFVIAGVHTARAEGMEPPMVTAWANGPGWITIYYEQLADSDNEQSEDSARVAYLIEREGGGSRIMYTQTGLFTDVDLTPDTSYKYRVCAVSEDQPDRKACSDWTTARTLLPQARPPNFAPPSLTDFQATADAIKISWGPTGDYTRILLRLADPDGNVDQPEVSNTAYGSHIFPGLRAGVRYQVLLKGCSLTLFGSSCGTWSPEVFIETSPPRVEPAPPSTPLLKVTSYSDSSVSLEFSVTLERGNANDRFVVYRAGTEIATVLPRGIPSGSGLTSSYTDQIAARLPYHVCYQAHSPVTLVCSQTVSRPLLLSEQPVSEFMDRPAKCVVRLGPCTSDSTDTLDLALPYGPDTCASGFVWRNAWPGDVVCVTPATRAQVVADNAHESVRRVPGGSACVSGYVWRVARAEDLVCVTPEVRTHTSMDNAQANARRMVPR